MRSRNLLLSLVLLVGAFCAEGCGVTTQVVYYPSFFDSNMTYDSIAVAPVQNDRDFGRFVRQLDADIVRELKYNNYYHVSDFTNEMMSDEGLIAYLRDYNVSDLAVFNTLIDYDNSLSHEILKETEERPVYLVDEYGDYIYDDDGHAIIDYYEDYDVYYDWYTREMTAYMKTVVRRVQDGEALYNKNLYASCSSEGYSVEELAHPVDLLQCAVSRLPAKAVYQISPTIENVVLDKNDTIAVMAMDEGKNKWVEEDEFNSGSKVRIELWFPKKAYYNNFMLDIVVKDTNAALASENIYWEGNTVKFDYNIDDLLSQANGQKEFEARVWNREQLLFSKSFEVK